MIPVSINFATDDIKDVMEMVPDEHIFPTPVPPGQVPGYVAAGFS
jgi:hypothetical protein